MSHQLKRVIIILGLVLTAVSILGFSLQNIAQTKLQIDPIIDPKSLHTAQSAIDITVDEVVASGLTCPVQVTHAGDGSGRLFVVEQVGRIKIISETTVLGTPFLDISSLVTSPGGCTGSEQGLLGLTFHPNYKSNGYFYVNYTRKSDGATIVAQYEVSKLDSNVASLTETPVFSIAQPFSNHNGGQIFFGPDGYLYIGLGDGGSGNDPGNRAQTLTELQGKMLRIDVNPSGSPNPPNCGSGAYSIPTSNPFVNQAGTCNEIWLIGLRNPWRFSFDRSTGDMFIGDVGQVTWEEVSYVAAGEKGLNLGWKLCEGKHIRGSTTNLCNIAGLTYPIVEYLNANSDPTPSNMDQAVTGGFIYRGQLYAPLNGYYFYADYASGKIWSVKKTSPTTWSVPDLELATGFRISAFGEDEQGELYVIEYEFANGKIRRLQDVNGISPNLSTSAKTASAVSVDPGGRITYTLRLHDLNGPTTNAITLSDTIPVGLAYIPGSLTATQGTVNETLSPSLTWNGILTPSPTITVVYAVSATNAVTGSITNVAQVNGQNVTPFTLPHTIFVSRQLTYLPIVLKNN